MYGGLTVTILFRTRSPTWLHPLLQHSAICDTVHDVQWPDIDNTNLFRTRSLTWFHSISSIQPFVTLYMMYGGLTVTILICLGQGPPHDFILFLSSSLAFSHLWHCVMYSGLTVTISTCLGQDPQHNIILFLSSSPACSHSWHCMMYDGLIVTILTCLGQGPPHDFILFLSSSPAFSHLWHCICCTVAWQWHLILNIRVQGGHAPGWQGQGQLWVHPSGRSNWQGNSHCWQFVPAWNVKYVYHRIL